MSDTHDDFINEAKRIASSCGMASHVGLVNKIATGLQEQYRAGFAKGQREGEDFQIRQNAYQRS